MTLLSLKGNELGFGQTLIGLIGSSYFFGYMLGCRFAGRFVEGVAHIRTFAGLAAICTCVASSYAMWANPVFWMVLRCITGFCMAGLYIVVESWVNQMAVNSNRGHVISQYRIVDISSNMAAQSLLFFFKPQGMELFGLFGIFLAASIIPITMTRTGAVPEVSERQPVKVRELLNKIPYPAVGCFLLGLFNSSLWALSPIFLIQQVQSSHAVPLFGLAYLAGGLACQKPIGQWSDKRDRRIIILACALMTSVLTFLIPLVAQKWVSYFFPLVFLYGSFSVPIYSLCIALAHDQSKKGEFVKVSSGLLFLYGFGAIQGPFYSGLLVEFFGSALLFYYISGGFAIFSIYGVYRLFKREAIINQPAQYISVPKESLPFAFKVDPRSGSRGQIEDKGDHHS